MNEHFENRVSTHLFSRIHTPGMTTLLGFLCTAQAPSNLMAAIGINGSVLSISIEIAKETHCIRQ